MKRIRLGQPPLALRRAHLDNLLLLPGSALPFKEQWQAIANSLHPREILIVLPRVDRPPRRALEAVAELLRAKGRHVLTLQQPLTTPWKYLVTTRVRQIEIFL